MASMVERGKLFHFPAMAPILKTPDAATPAHPILRTKQARLSDNLCTHRQSIETGSAHLGGNIGGHGGGSEGGMTGGGDDGGTEGGGSGPAEVKVKLLPPSVPRYGRSSASAVYVEDGLGA